MIRADEHPELKQAFQEIESFYQTVKALYTGSAFAQRYPLTDLWASQNMQTLLDIIHKETDPVTKIANIQSTFMFSAYASDEEIKSRVIDWYLDYLLSQGIHLGSLDVGLQESPYSNSLNSLYREGRLLSPDFLRTLTFSLEIEKFCKLPERRFKVLEIGAGYGGLARALKLRWAQMSYVIIDIPESLYFSSVFLRLNFPKSKCCFVTDASCLSGFIEDFDFVFVPTILAESLAGSEFTLFCNTASLGEMRNSVIRYWMDFVQNRVEVKYFFGLNRFLNTIHPKGQPEHQSFRLDENCCSVSFDDGWRILHWELEPPFTRCPYVETEVTRNLEVMAERLPKGSVHREENQRLSRNLVEDIARQDWYIYYEADNTMKLRDNVLAPDLTMKGTLFALWESIRLHPNPVNVAMMLKYLSTLTRGKPFEEMFYYQDLLKSLDHTTPAPTEPSPQEPGSSVRDFLRQVTPAPIRQILRRLYYGS